MFKITLLFFFFGVISAQTMWIFGYGSLISQSSRDSTYVTNLPWKPVKVFGIGRGWWAPGTVTAGWAGIINQDEQTAPTFLGAYFDNSSTINGVIFQVNSTAKAAFDVRELTGAGYTVITVPYTSITAYDGVPLTSSDTIYFYNVPADQLTLPTEEAPIVTSYIDIIMNSCLAIDAVLNPGYYNFSLDFVATTQGWSPYWVNDRLLPRRPWVYSPNSAIIDNILSQYINSSILGAIVFDNPQFEQEEVQIQQQLDALKAQIADLQKSVSDLQSQKKAQPSITYPYSFWNLSSFYLFILLRTNTSI